VTASGEGLALFIDKEALTHKIEADAAFGSRFYRALAIFLADRLRGIVRHLGYGGATTFDAQVIEMDEHDPAILDVGSMAGDRFDRMLKTVVGES
jgi:hypothetical protein